MELEWRTFHAHIWLWLGIPENVYDDWHIHHRKLSKWHRLQFIIDFILYRCQRAAPVLFHRKWTRYCFKGNSNDSYLIHMYIHHIQFVSLIRHSNATHINRTTCTSEFCVKLKVEWKLTVNLKKKNDIQQSIQLLCLLAFNINTINFLVFLFFSSLARFDIK